MAMPRSMMSEASSGGVFSSTAFTQATIWASGSWSASVISLELISMVRGSPTTWSRPCTCMIRSFSSGMALPILILISSAVGSPMAKLYLRRIKFWMASSKRIPPTRTELATTMPFIETTAASAVPPPISNTKLPVAVSTGSPAPKAAAKGSRNK